MLQHLTQTRATWRQIWTTHSLAQAGATNLGATTQTMNVFQQQWRLLERHVDAWPLESCPKNPHTRSPWVIENRAFAADNMPVCRGGLDKFHVIPTNPPLDGHW